MASGLYNTGLEKLLDGTIVWDTSDIRCLLLKSGYTYDPDHDVVNDLTPGSYEITVSGYARQALANESLTRDDTNNRVTLDADDTAFGALSSGETIVAAVLYLYNASDASAQLLVYVDLTDTPTNGSTVTIQWHSDGIVYFPS